MSGSIAASGNVMSLMDENNFETKLVTDSKDYYRSLFYNCAALTTAPELPATTLTVDSCYTSMFYGCSNLITAPELPATTLT